MPLVVIFIASFRSIPVAADQRKPFEYKLVLTPEEGPVDHNVERRYTVQFRKCQDRAVSTLEQESCFAAEFERQDKLLNLTWRKTLALAPKMRKRLVAAQRKWIAERDPFCRSKTDEFRGGTIVPIIYEDCRVEQTIRRMMWLEKLR